MFEKCTYITLYSIKNIQFTWYNPTYHDINPNQLLQHIYYNYILLLMKITTP